MNLQEEVLFVEALPILEQLRKSGYEAYFVGGSVRDKLLGKSISDVDIATSATPQEVKTIFPHTVDVGIEHGTVMVLYHKKGYEVTTFRTEEGYQDFRHPDQVTFVRSLREDLKRRDFTINALAVGIDGQVIDYFDGVGDLQRKMLRCVGNPTERFNEDALRMFRSVRFVGQLGFELEEMTKQAIAALRMNLAHVAVERMKVEFDKLIMSPHRLKGMQLLIDTQLYEACPLFTDKREALEMVAQFPLVRMTDVQAWILLAHHCKLTESQIKHLLKAWKVSNELLKQVAIGYQTLQLRLEQEWNWQMAYRCPQEVALQVEQLVTQADDSSTLQRVKEIYRQLPIRSMKDIEVNGNDIIQILQLESKGPIIGQILQEMEKRILNGELSNQRDILQQFMIQEYL